MGIHQFFFGLSVDERERFAATAGTTRGVLTQIAYANKRVELGFADVIVKLSEGRLSLDDVPLTDNAKRQRAIREGVANAPELNSTEGAPDPETEAAHG